MAVFNILYEIKLSVVGILAIIFGTIGLAATVLLIASQYRLTRLSQNNIEENDKLIAVTVNPKTMHHLEKQVTISLWIAAIGLLLTLISIYSFLKYNNIAKTYGAYERIQLSQTIAQIKECEKTGYIESTDIPDDLSGCIVIYFKYGCPDCRDIHDALMDYLKENPIEKLYFVSSRSDKGKELLQSYPVNEVPSGIYVRQKESNVSDIYWEVLYQRAGEDKGIPATFNRKGMDFLVARQNDGD